VVGGDHAGIAETALMLHLRPDLVEMAALRQDDFWYCWEPGKESQAATVALGQRMFTAMLDALVAEIQALTTPAHA
jgi:creatinine amidohydrolase/Fe(II)-dependent formamide hydrolase-like protein